MNEDLDVATGSNGTLIVFRAVLTSKRCARILGAHGRYTRRVPWCLDSVYWNLHGRAAQVWASPQLTSYIAKIWNYGCAWDWCSEEFRHEAV